MHYIMLVPKERYSKKGQRGQQKGKLSAVLPIPEFAPVTIAVLVERSLPRRTSMAELDESNLTFPFFASLIDIASLGSTYVVRLLT